MALVTSKKMFEQAYKNGYAIGAFNVNNMEIVQGITEACKEENKRSGHRNPLFCKSAKAQGLTQTTPISLNS